MFSVPPTASASLLLESPPSVAARDKCGYEKPRTQKGVTGFVVGGEGVRRYAAVDTAFSSSMTSISPGHPMDAAAVSSVVITSEGTAIRFHARYPMMFSRVIPGS